MSVHIAFFTVVVDKAEVERFKPDRLTQLLEYRRPGQDDGLLLGYTFMSMQDARQFLAEAAAGGLITFDSWAIAEQMHGQIEMGNRPNTIDVLETGGGGLLPEYIAERRESLNA